MATTDPTLPVVKNMVLLDSEGKRIAVKYYSQDWPTVQAQSSFERSLWDKTSRTNARQEAEIVMFDDYIIVYKYLGDLMFYVTGSVDENELILFQVLTAFFESISIMLRQQVEKKTVLENLDLVLLAMDELIDGGMTINNLSPNGSAPGCLAPNGSMTSALMPIDSPKGSFSRTLVEHISGAHQSRVSASSLAAFNNRVCVQARGVPPPMIHTPSVIVETEPVMIASRATMRGSDEPTVGGGAAPTGGMPMLAEKSLANAFLSAKEHLTRSLLR